MKLPTEEECFALFRQYNVPQQIKEHCIAVSEFAASIAVRLKEKGININLERVKVGGLLHDMMKAVALDNISGFNGYVANKEEISTWKKLRRKYKGKHESEVAYELLKEKHPELAEFLLKEGKLSNNMVTDRSWEEKVVHYADFRLQGNKIINFDERLDYIGEQYFKGRERKWKIIKEIEKSFEKEIKNIIGEI